MTSTHGELVTAVLDHHGGRRVGVGWRDRVTLIDDATAREPYHAAIAVPLSEAPALIESVEETAAAAAEATTAALVALHTLE